MRSYLILAVVVSLLAAFTPAVQAQSAADEAAVRGMVEQRFAMANKHDAKAWAALLHENAEGWSGSRKGRAAWEQYESDYWRRQKNVRYMLLEEVCVHVTGI